MCQQYDSCGLSYLHVYKVEGSLLGANARLDKDLTMRLVRESLYMQQKNQTNAQVMGC